MAVNEFLFESFQACATSTRDLEVRWSSVEKIFFEAKEFYESIHLREKNCLIT